MSHASYLLQMPYQPFFKFQNTENVSYFAWSQSLDQVARENHFKPSWKDNCTLKIINNKCITKITS